MITANPCPQGVDHCGICKWIAWGRLVTDIAKTTGGLRMCCAGWESPYKATIGAPKGKP